MVSQSYERARGDKEGGFLGTFVKFLQIKTLDQEHSLKYKREVELLDLRNRRKKFKEKHPFLNFFMGSPDLVVSWKREDFYPHFARLYSGPALKRLILSGNMNPMFCLKVEHHPASPVKYLVLCDMGTGNEVYLDCWSS